MLRDKPLGGDNGVFYTVGNHEEAVMTIEQRLERLERRANRYQNFWMTCESSDGFVVTEDITPRSNSEWTGYP